MIMLLNDYYRIDSRVAENDDTFLFGVMLFPEYRAYTGHFPGNPISPGVCNIQMIKECAEQLAGKHLFLNYIAKCRFSTVLTPQTTDNLQLRMRITGCEPVGTYQALATLFDDTATYMEFKGEFAEIK